MKYYIAVEKNANLHASEVDTDVYLDNELKDLNESIRMIKAKLSGHSFSKSEISSFLDREFKKAKYK
jgi:hypothetical protein